MNNSRRTGTTRQKRTLRLLVAAGYLLVASDALLLGGRWITPISVAVTSSDASCGRQTCCCGPSCGGCCCTTTSPALDGSSGRLLEGDSDAPPPGVRLFTAFECLGGEPPATSASGVKLVAAVFGFRSQIVVSPTQAVGAIDGRRLPQFFPRPPSRVPISLSTSV